MNRSTASASSLCSTVVGESLEKQKAAKRKLHRAIAGIAGGMLAFAGMGQVSAATKTYDGDGVGAPAGGSGVWDTTLLRFHDGSAYTAFVADDTAVFGGTGGYVHLAAAIQGNISVTGGEYFFAAPPSSGGSIIWASTGGVLDVAPGATASLDFSIGGNANGLSIQGGGTAVMYGAFSTNGGLVTVTGNTTVVYANGAPGLFGGAPANNSLQLNAGSTMDLRWANDTWNGLSGGGNIILGGRGGTSPGLYGIERQTTGGTLVIGNLDASSSFSGNISDDGKGFPGIGGGGGRVTKQGTGTLVLTGSNTYRGPTRISASAAAATAGTIEISGGNAIPDLSSVNFGRANAAVAANSGRLDLTGSNETVGSIGGFGGTVDVDTGTLTLGGDNYNMDANNTVIEGSGLVVKVGTGNQGLTNTLASTFTGKYRVDSGGLHAQTDARFGAVPGALVTDSITLNGGNLGNTPVGGMTMAATRGISVTASSGLFATGSGASILSIPSPITGAANLTKTGVGQVNIGADNSASYTGDWTISEGLVSANTATASASPLGTGSINISRSTLLLNPGTAASTWGIASGAGEAVNYGPGTIVDLRNTVIATAGALNQNAGGTMLITAASGFANLGTTGEKLIVTGGVATTATNSTGGGPNSVVPRVLASTGGAGTEGIHTTYDVTNGFIPATYSTNGIDAAVLGDDLVTVSGGAVVSLTGARSAIGVRVGAGGGSGNGIDLNAQTLTVGSAGIILNTTSNITATGGGTIAFGSNEGLIYGQGAAGTISGTITGSGGLTKLGYGPVTLNTTNSYTGDTRVSQGKLILPNAVVNPLPTSTNVFLDSGINSTTLNTVLDLNGSTQSVNSINSTFGSTSATVSAPQIALGGGGRLNITGSGNMTYMGGMTTGGGGVLAMTGGGTLRLGVPVSTSGSTSPVLSYNTLVVSGGSTVSLSSGNSIPNAVTSPVSDIYQIDNGTIRISSLTPNSAFSSAGSSSFGFPSTNRGILIGAGGATIEVSDPLEIVLGNSAGASINGSGRLTIKGPGTFRLPGAANQGTNTATGGMTIDGAAVQLTAEASTGPAPGALVSDHIRLKNNGILASDSANLNGVNALNATRGIFVEATGGALRNNLALEVNGPLSGSGPLTLWSNQTGNGFRTFRASSDGTVSATPYTGTVTLASNAQTVILANNALGTGTITNDPTFSNIFSTTTNVTMSNAFVLNKGSYFDFRQNGSTNSMELTGVVSGNADWFKGVNGTNAGSLILSNAANSFTGTVSVNAGTLIPRANGALGPTARPIVVNQAGTLGFDSGLIYASAKPVVISGNGALGAGAINNIGGNNTFAGPVTLSGPARVGSASGRLDLTGVVGGAADSPLTKIGADRVALAGVNTYAGGTIIQEGTLIIGADANLGTSTLTFDGGTLNVTAPVATSRSVVVGGLNGGTGTIDTSSSFTIQGAGNTTLGTNLTIQSNAAPGGSVTFNRSGGTVTVTNGVVVQIDAGATLNLDGLQVTSDGTNHANILNNSTTSFNTIGGTHNVGNVDGTGKITASNNGKVTANYVRQVDAVLSNSGIIKIRTTLNPGNGGTGAGASVLPALPTVGASAMFDLNDSKLVVQFGTNASPVVAARAAIIAGRGGTDFGAATWQGTGGIASDAAAVGGTGDNGVNPGDGISFAIGYVENSFLPALGLSSYNTFGGVAVDSGSLLIRFTRGADCNLDGMVNTDDVTIVGATFGTTNAEWSYGDFDYDGVVDSDDVTVLGALYDATAPALSQAQLSAQYGGEFAAAFARGQAMAAVPEPTALSLLGLGGLAMLKRRRRK